MSRPFKITLRFFSLGVFGLILLICFPNHVLGQIQTIPINLPDCDSNNPEVKFVNSNADFNDINNSEYKIFCVSPGEYESIALNIDGSESDQRYIRYYNPSSPSDNAPPWNQAENLRTIIKGRTEINAAYWIIDRITFDDTEYGQIRFENNSHHVILNRILVQHGIDMILLTEGHHHTIQNSVLRNSMRRPSSIPGEHGLDSHCIMTGQAKYTKILNNEIYDCAGDSIQANDGLNDINSPDGTIIANNEMYITNALYAYCNNSDPNSSLNPNGNCACAENAIDIKATTRKNPDQILIEDITQIKNNIMYGFRLTHQSCGSTGGPGSAMGLVDHPYVTHAIFENNVTFDSVAGLGIGYGPNHITIRNNLFYNIYNPIPADEPNDNMWVLNFIFGENIEFYHNTIIGIGGAYDDYYLRHSNAARYYDFLNNLFVLSGEEKGRDNDKDRFGSTNRVGYNGFFETEEFTNVLNSSTNVVSSNAADAQLGGEYCFTVNKHTNPHTECFYNIKPTQNSPFINQGDPNVGSKSNIGIDDIVGVTIDLSGNLRDDGQPDMGAFEYTEPTTPTLPQLFLYWLTDTLDQNGDNKVNGMDFGILLSLE